MKIELVPEFEYTARAYEFPVDVVVEVDADQEISSKIDVTGALLVSIDNSAIEFGYVQRTTPAEEQSMLLCAGDRLCFRVNIFEHDDDFSNFQEGNYKCSIKIELRRKIGDRYRPVFLEDEIVISVSA